MGAFAAMKHIKQRLRSRRGFGMAETMLCMLLLTLSTGALLGTLSQATAQFRARTRDSEAEILCLMLAQAMQHKLTYASHVTLNVDEVTEFTTSAGADNAPCSFGKNAAGELVLRFPATEEALVSPESYYTVDGGRFSADCELYWRDDRFSAVVRVLEGEEPLSERSFSVIPALLIMGID